MDPVVHTGLALLADVCADIWEGVGDLVSTISGNALLLIPLAGAFASLVIGLTMKLMGIRRGRSK